MLSFLTSRAGAGDGWHRRRSRRCRVHHHLDLPCRELIDRINQENEDAVAQDDRKIAADHRQSVREELSNMVLRQMHIESDVATLKNKVAAHERVTVEVTTLRTKAEGAGTLGRWLIRFGIGIVTVAGWIIGAYTWLTGRPP